MQRWNRSEVEATTVDQWLVSDPVIVLRKHPIIVMQETTLTAPLEQIEFTLIILFSIWKKTGYGNRVNGH